MTSHRLSVRTLSVTAALVATYVGCATQEDMPDSLGLGSGAESSGPAPSDAGSSGSVASGGAAGALSPPKGGSAGASSGNTGGGGAPLNVAGAAGSGPATGGTSGGVGGGGAGGGGAAGGGAGGKATGGTGATEPDKTSPSTPGSLQTTTITPTSVTLTWTESTDEVGVIGYRLFNGNREVTALLGTTYTFTNLTASTAYTFGVQAYDAAQNHSVRATKSATTTAPPVACQAGNTVAKLNHGQSHTVNGNACIELNVNPAWNPVEILLEQTGGGTLTYSSKSCKGNASGTIATVLTLFQGNNPNCNFFVQLSGSGTVVYYD